MNSSITKFSALSLLRGALGGHQDWQPFWRKAEPKSRYDVVIVGGGGHGLATAYYLATRYGMSNIAVLERAWVGGGNTGRNTTIVRSNYLQPVSARFYDHALKGFESMNRELDYNVMFSQRGVVTLAFSRHELRLMNRRVEALRHEGVDSEMLSAQEVAMWFPGIELVSASGRRIFGGFLQRRGGVARHDAVAWGYARGADKMGVDIIENCEVTGFRTTGGTVTAVETSRGVIQTDKLGLAVAGHSSQLASLLDIKLPISSMALQAMVSEPVKPVLDTVLDGGFYVSQSDRGELVMGGGTDVYTSYAQRGNLPRVEDNMTALLDLFPRFGNLRFMRQWAGIVDITPDSSPIISATHWPNVYLNCGWGTYGFKAIPAGGETFAHLLATGKAHELAEPFGLQRFATGALVDEVGSSGMDDREALL